MRGPTFAPGPICDRGLRAAPSEAQVGPGAGSRCTTAATNGLIDGGTAKDRFQFRNSGNNKDVDSPRDV
jgi:hypothetical protein